MVVQATQNGLGAAAVVVLHKVHTEAGDLVEVLLVEAFKKVASTFAEHFGLEDQQVGVGVELTVFGMCGTLAMTFFARRAGYRTVRGV